MMLAMAVARSAMAVAWRWLAPGVSPPKIGAQPIGSITTNSVTKVERNSAPMA